MKKEYESPELELVDLTWILTDISIEGGEGSQGGTDLENETGGESTGEEHGLGW